MNREFFFRFPQLNQMQMFRLCPPHWYVLYLPFTVVNINTTSVTKIVVFFSIIVMALGVFLSLSSKILIKCIAKLTLSNCDDSRYHKLFGIYHIFVISKRLFDCKCCLCDCGNRVVQPERQWIFFFLVSFVNAFALFLLFSKLISCMLSLRPLDIFIFQDDGNLFTYLGWN